MHRAMHMERLDCESYVSEGYLCSIGTSFWWSTMTREC
jgi:hypothetical protein